MNMKKFGNWYMLELQDVKSGIGICLYGSIIFCLNLGSVGAASVPSGTNTSQRTTEEYTAPATVEIAAPNTSSSVILGFEEMHINTVPFSRANAVPNPSSHTVSEVEDIHMFDEADRPLILSDDREIPFTYLASLSAKLAAVNEKSSSVQGKIKVYILFSLSIR